MPLTASVRASISATQTLAGDLGSGKFDAAISVLQAFLDGAGAGAADRMFKDTRTLAASAAEDLDVATGGGLIDAFGAALAMARIKAVIVKAAPGNTNNVRISRPAANGVPLFFAAGDGLDIKPGGVFLWMAPDAAGVVVTAATADLISLANSAAGSAVTYDIIILGAAT